MNSGDNCGGVSKNPRACLWGETLGPAVFGLCAGEDLNLHAFGALEPEGTETQGKQAVSAGSGVARGRYRSLAGNNSGDSPHYPRAPRTRPVLEQKFSVSFPALAASLEAAAEAALTAEASK